MANQKIGYIVGGGLKNSFLARLSVTPSEVQEGSFVVIDSGTFRFYGLITDLQLGATDPRFADERIDDRLPSSLSRELYGQTLFTNIEILPSLMLDRGPDPISPAYAEWSAAHQDLEPQIMPVKTVPVHHSAVSLADQTDIAAIFGIPDKKGNFVIGTTREQGHPICINLEKFVQRSAGVFGATGTGKSFLTRIMLAGLIQYDKASVLVLDMHNEYGFDDLASDTKTPVPGLKTKFNAKVQVVGLGKGSKIRDGAPPDYDLEIEGRDISTTDIELLTGILNLRETTSTTLHSLNANFGEDWFMAFKSMNFKEDDLEDEKGRSRKVPASGSVAAWAEEAGVNVMAAEALRRKLDPLFKKSYIIEKSASKGVGLIIDQLQSGKHVILSFGKFESDLDYLLVSNIITRKIREAWVEKTNQYRSHKKEEPRPLVIVVEEAHKLLNREMANQTAFATIARELRKYYVTLMIVDQRPSQIYDEVLSQLGTRISGWLGDDDDVHAVLAGLANREAIKGMLARLQPKEEVILLGWGVPIPLPIRSRRYNQQFWKELFPNLDDEVNSNDKFNAEFGFES
ncbi:MAG TPA: ATP-binding protein [Anaerolineales bacterium]|nr:ATP-binding protein [Anaerolineales bacterium]